MNPGDVLGKHYELESRLGKGGMGEVWRARNSETNERVAVKVLLDELAQDSALQKRFLREARAAAAVKHPNVVELRDVQEGEDGAPFLVMELLEGETLGRRLRRRAPLSIAETAAIMLPVFDAVEAAHAAGLVHRDLKPENIFLSRERDGHARVCVLDFGIAKRIEKLAAPTAAASAETTAAPATTGAMLGTPYYMAPEQALGEKDVDGLADVWSLGVILYECLAGKRPTEAATLGAILKIIVTDGVVPLWEVMPGVDGALAGAVMRMLRTSREERAPSLTEIRTELRLQLPPSFVLDAGQEETGPPSVSQDAASTRPIAVDEKKRRPPLLALGLAVLAVGGIGIALATRAHRTETVAAPLASSSVVATVTTAPPPSAAAAAASASASASATPSASASASASASLRRPRPQPSPAPSVAVAASPPSPSTTPSALGRGPSGLVTDNPFAAPAR